MWKNSQGSLILICFLGFRFMVYAEPLRAGANMDTFTYL